jgi:hypothetical protein
VSIIEIAKIQVRRGQENTTGVPQLAPGEFGWAQDTENLYIGKRIAEGANTDDNSRILTQKDYDNLFAIAMGAGRDAVASTSTYRYRDNLDFALFASTTTFIGTKLDAFVSLTDFGVTASSTATDIYNELNTAVQNLFANIYFQGDTRRNLIIPAGNYYISDTIELPPYASLVGEGPGMTNLLSLNNDRPMFKTVDANGVAFESTMAEQNSQFGSRFVNLEGMTLAYTTGTAVNHPLVYFDNTEHSNINRVEFTVVDVVNTSTGTVLINSSTIYGTAISLRGERRSGIEQNKNVTISNCNFKKIGTGVLGTGSVAYSLIEDCNFADLKAGIIFSAFNGDVYRTAPTNAIITKNNFEYIENQAIFVGTATDQTTFLPNVLNHSSSFNSFYKVGNGPGLGDLILTNTGTAVISCYGSGFNSINDKFSRKEFANPIIGTTSTTFFYKPLVEGVTLENATSITIKDLGTSQQILDRLYVTGKTVSYKIPYKLEEQSNNYYTRSGMLTITIVGNPNYTPLGSVGSISDYYDFSFDNTIWPVGANGGNYTNGEFNHPEFSLVPTANESYLNLVYNWTVAPTTSTLSLQYQTNIIS